MSQYLYYRGDKLCYTYTVSDGSPYTCILLDYRGNLSWNNTTLSWIVASNGYTHSYCDLYGSCGPFSYCDAAAVPTKCRCLDGFELVDSLNLSRGCHRKEALGCGKENNFMTMPNMKVLTNSCTLGIQASTSVRPSAVKTARVWRTRTLTLEMLALWATNRGVWFGQGISSTWSKAALQRTCTYGLANLLVCAFRTLHPVILLSPEVALVFSTSG